MGTKGKISRVEQDRSLDEALEPNFPGERPDRDSAGWRHREGEQDSVGRQGR